MSEDNFELLLGLTPTLIMSVCNAIIAPSAKLFTKLEKYDFKS